MTEEMRSRMLGLILGAVSMGTFPNVEPMVPQNRLVSADGYILQDANGLILISKEAE